MSKQHGHYETGKRCFVTHELSQTVLATDAPPDNNGLGRSFSPTDLVGTALATCMMTIMGIAAERQGIDLGGARFEIQKEMSANPPRRIGRLSVVFHLPGKNLTDEQKQRLQLAAEACPVSRSLHPDVQHDVIFQWI